MSEAICEPCAGWWPDDKPGACRSRCMVWSDEGPIHEHSACGKHAEHAVEIACPSGYLSVELCEGHAAEWPDTKARFNQDDAGGPGA